MTRVKAAQIEERYGAARRDVQGQPVFYLFTFHDFAGKTLGSEGYRCSSDVRAVVRAVQMIRDHPQCDAVEVRTVNDRLVRRVERADVT